MIGYIIFFTTIKKKKVLTDCRKEGDRSEQSLGVLEIADLLRPYENVSRIKGFYHFAGRVKRQRT